MADTCAHPTFEAHVCVNRVEDIGKFVAEIQVRCAVCQIRFRFVGPDMGLDYRQPMVGVSRLELRAPIEPDPDMTMRCAEYSDTRFPTDEKVGRWNDELTFDGERAWDCEHGSYPASIPSCGDCGTVRPPAPTAPSAAAPNEELSARELAEAWDATTPKYGHAWVNLSVAVRQHVCDFARRIAGAVSARGGEA